jgi:acyl carrier protein
MNDQPLKESVSQLILDIAPEVDMNALDPNDDMRDELDLDSIDFVRLLTSIEQKLGVRIPEGDYAQVNTLQKMLDYIAQNR